MAPLDHRNGFLEASLTDQRAAQAEGAVADAVSVAHLGRDLHGLAPGGDGLRELTRLGEAPRGWPRDSTAAAPASRTVAGRTVPLRRASVSRRLTPCSIPESPPGGAERGEPDDLERHVLGTLCDDQGSLGRAHGLLRLAHVDVVLAHEREHASQSMLVT